ncbi:MAG: tetratricopeptide repeat protein [Bradymonadales bacterium]|nr:tetratricopeptide repeat protein [Bradymonadales bacterium]
MTQKQPGSAMRLVERISLALALLCIPLVATTGFSRYEVAKTAVLAVTGSLVAICWLADFIYSGWERRLPARTGAVFGWLFLLWACASLFWSPWTGESLLSLTLWVTFFAAYLSVASSPCSVSWVTLPLLGSGLLVALVVLLQHAGVTFPPAIPTGMAADAGTYGSFDHALFAGCFLAMAAPLGLVQIGVWGGRNAAWLVLLANLPICLAVGRTGLLPAVCALGGLAVGGALSTGSRRRAPAPLPVWIGLVFSIGAVLVGLLALGSVLGPPAGQESPADQDRFGALRAAQLQRVHRIELAENAITTPEEWLFEWKRIRNIPERSAILGGGVGSWAYSAGLGVDPEDAYYRQPREEYHIHDRPAGFLLGVPAELGWVGVILFLGFLLGALVAGVQGLFRGKGKEQPASGFLVGAALAGLVIGLLTSGGYHAAEGLTFFAVLGLAAQLGQHLTEGGLCSAQVIHPARGGFGRVERWLLLGLPALALIVVSLVATARFTLADYKRQQGEVYFEASMPDQAMEALTAAVRLWPSDARAQYLLGTVRFFTPGDQGRLETARENFRRMAELRPHDIRFALPSVRDELRRTAIHPESHAQNIAGLQNRLTELLRLDPRNADARHLMSELLSSKRDFDGAATVLTELLDFQHSDQEKGETRFALGQIFENGLEQPQDALEQYLQAARLLTAPHPLLHQLAERISFVRAWIDQGVRPDPSEPH